MVMCIKAMYDEYRIKQKADVHITESDAWK